MSRSPGRIAVICPTARDRLHLARPEIRARYDVELFGTDEATHEPGFDAIAFLQATLEAITARRQEFAGLLGVDDFPACMIAALIAERLGFPFPSFQSLFLCQHKYYSRLEQQRAAPEATPRFQAIDITREPIAPALELPLPVFAKPVKSYLSILARPLRTPAELSATAVEARTRLAPVATMFDRLVAASALPAEYRVVPASALLVEELIEGTQVTLDGYVADGEVVVLGIVDSHFAPGTASFTRFEYPSCLPAPVRARMARVAEACVRRVGLARTFFDVELFYRERDDSMWIIEINGRMSSQFAPLYAAVDGIDLYAMQLAMARGGTPTSADGWKLSPPGGGVAGSFVLRRFADARVVRAPSAADVERLLDRFPGTFVEILVREGEKLSDELQDDESYRYALIDVWARDRAALTRRFAAVSAALPFVFDPITAVA